MTRPDSSGRGAAAGPRDAGAHAGPDEPSGASPVRVVAAVVRREAKVLLTQRPPGGAHPLLWEFPGGKIEPGETARAALEREVREELGVGCRAGATLAVTRHRYPAGIEVEIHFIAAELAAIEFTPSAAIHAARWIAPSAIDVTEVLAGDRDFVRALAGENP